MSAPSVTRQPIEEFSRSATVPRHVPGVSNLTEREVQVLQQPARGRSNAEFASALFVSEAPVKTHVSHILSKLDLRDRVQAVSADESGLVSPEGGTYFDVPRPSG